MNALELDPKDAIAWNNLGVVGGGSVGGQEYSAWACLEKSNELKFGPGPDRVQPLDAP